MVVSINKFIAEEGKCELIHQLNFAEIYSYVPKSSKYDLRSICCGNWHTVQLFYI